jgi:hypothetical protein
VYQFNQGVNNMPKPLVQQIQELQDEMKWVKAELEEFEKNTIEKNIVPYTKSGGNKDQSQQKSVDISTGLSVAFSGAVVWNDTEIKFPPYGTKPDNPTQGYNRHSHSRFSGGALDIKTLEIVEYDIDWVNDTLQKDCQSLWRTLPPIKKQQNTDLKDVEKIGLLDLIFNPDAVKWGVSAFEIDVTKCYLVQRDPTTGEIVKDENETEKKALLFNIDQNKTNIVWDKNAQCWRFYAVYSGEPVAPEEPTP